MKKSLVWSLMLILICIGVLGFAPSAEAATSILMEETHVNAVTNGYILGNSTITQRRADIAIISIEDALPSVLPDGTWDVSKEKNGTVQAWLTVNASDSTKYDLHIAANGSIIAADGYYLFYMYRNCTEIRGLDKLDTSRIIRMYEMFGICENLTSLDLSGFNTSNVTNMSRMFSDCRSLTNLDVSNFDTSKVTSMSYMFYSCNSLTSLDVSNFNTSNVTDMSNMFYNCRSLTSLDVSSFNTSKVTSMGSMFPYCSSLTSLDVSNFNTSNVTDMSNMFYNCSSLTSLDVSNFNTSKVTSMQSMFVGCRSLTSLDVSNFNTSKVTKMTYMFNGCSSLKSLVLGMNFDKINGSSMFGATSKLTAIIAQSTTPRTLSTYTGISTNTILYVPNVTAETAYEAATNYSTVFGANRIRPILELVGGENIDVAINDSYTDEATVAGFNINTEADMFKQYGYYVVTENNVVANIVGTYTVKHTLYYKNPNVVDAVAEEVMSVTRTVNVIEAAVSLTANGVTTNYVSFEDAITAANADSENITHFSKGIIKLLKDCTMASGVIINRNKDIVLDLNGYKLDANAITTQNVISCGDGSSYYPELAILDNSTAKTGTIERTTDAGNYYIVGADIVVTVGTNDETVNTVSPKINTSGLSFYNWGANYWGNRGGFYDGQIIAKKDSISASEAPYVPSGYNINKETSGELSTYTLVKDTTSPTLSLDIVYNITKSREDLANSNDEIGVAININDNYNVSNYFDNSVVDNFIFKVNGVKIAPKILNINYSFVDDNTFGLSITLTNVTGNGVLSVEIPEGAAKDLAGNTNATTTLMSTMMIDNMPPTDTSAVINNGNKYTNKNTVTIDLNAVGALFVKFKQGKAGGYAYRTFVTPATASEPNGIRVGVPDGFEIATLDSTTGEVNGIVKEEDYSTITSAMVKAGLVIVKVDYDTNNNIVYGDEFVWVPTTIDGVNFGVPTTELSTGEENEDVKKAVEKYGGFYIARYEASGIKYGYASASFIYDENTLLASASMENLKYAAAILKPTGTLKSVRNETPSVGIPFDYIKNACVNMYPGLSQMMGPYSYKATLQFLESQGINVVNAGSWGNTDVSNENIESEGLIPTGSNEAYKALNIYDLSGNAYEVLDEWTEKNTQKIKRAELENIKVASLVDSIKFAMSSRPSILYTVQGNTYDATTTSLYTTSQTGDIDEIMSFRPVLYLIDSVTDDDWLGYEENSQISYTFDEGDGLKVINAWFKDDAGNITEVVLGEIILDTVKPVVKVSNVSGRKVTLTLTDDVAGIDGYAITTTNVEPDVSAFTAVSPSALSKTVTYTANASGKYYAWAKDQAGNISLVDTFDAVNPILMEETFENVATNKYILGNSTITQRRKDVAIISIEDTLPSTLPDGAWDVSKDKNGSVQAWLTVNASDSTKYDLHIAANGNVIASSGQYLFRGYTRCSQIQGLDKLNTSSVTNMSSMFYQCGNLTSLDVSSLDTSKVTEMILMFSECSRLSTLNLNNFDTSNVTNMSGMFSYCTGLQSLNLGEKFNTGKVRNMSNMFSMCYRLTSIPEGLDLSNTAITSNDSTSSEGYAYMFMNCGALTSVTINSKYIGYQMFYGCDKLTDITITSDVQGVYNDGTTEKPSGAFTYTGTGTLKTNLNSSSTAITKTNYDWVSDKRSMGEPVLMAETKENVETNKYIFENSTITQRREDIAIISIENTLPSTLPSGAWDVSKNKDKSVYAWLTVNANNSAKYDLHIAGYGNVIASSGDRLFANYANCTTIQGLNNLNTASVTIMASMFNGCSSLTALDVSSFDTSNVTNMNGMFYKCSALKDLDLTNFDTSKVTDMAWMFAWCEGIKQFDVSKFNTTNVTTMKCMFEGCSSLLDIDLSNFNTSKVTNMAGMFLCCYSLKSLPTGLDLINTGITTNTSTSSGYAQMFRSCTSLTSVTIDSKYIGYQMFSGCNKLTDITVTSNVQGVYGTSTSFAYTGSGRLRTTLKSSSTAITETNYNWYADKRVMGDPILMAETKENVETNKYILGNSSITQRRKDVAIISIEDTLPDTLPDGAWDVSKNKDKSVYAWLTVNANNSAKYDLHIAGYGNVIASRGEYLFANYTNCTEIQGLSNLNTAIVANMASMFYGCSSLTALDVSSLNTSNVTNMNGMFYGCSGLTSLDLKNFDTTNVTTIGAMFHECTGLTSLDVSSFNTSNVTNMDGAFYKCSGLKSFDLANFDTSKVTDMSWMFAWCGGIKQFNLSNFNTTNVTNMRYMFEGCSSLLDIDLSNFSTSKVTNMAGMFLGCYSLKSLPTGLDLTNTGVTTNTSTSSGYAQMFHSCTSLTSATINSKYIGYRMFYGCNKLTDITITSDVQGVYSDGTTEKPSGAFTYTGTGKIKTTLNSSSTAITETNYDWAIDNRMLSSWHYMDSNGNYYSTLSEAFNGAATGSTITVIDDVNESTVGILTGKNVVFDLNGKTITVDSLSTSYIMIVEANTTLELKDTAGNGKIVRTSPNNTEKTGSSIHLIQNQGDLTITSGTYEIDYNESYITTISNSGNLTVNGGTIIAKGNATTTAGISAYSGKVTINGGTINASISGEAYCAYGVYNTGVKKAEIVINGGTINATADNARAKALALENHTGSTGTQGSSITVSGNAIITAKGTSPKAINNEYSTADVVIKGGTFTAEGTNARAIYSVSKVILGTKDGQVNTNSPVIQSSSIGIEATNGIEFYDGIIKGKTNAIAKNSKATSEDGYGVYIYQDGEYEIAIPMVGWDISKTAGTDNVWAFLVADSTDSTKYNLVIHGTGEMKDYADYDSSEWKAYRSQITKLIIEEGVTSVGDRAFFGMSEITNIEFPSTMKTIGAFSFFDCTKVIGTINIPASVNSIGGNPFLRVPVTKYTVEAGNTKYKVLNNAIVTIDGKEAISYPCGNTDTNIIVPDGVETIRGYAYASTKAVTIGLPNTLKSINFGGFAYNSSLPTIIIPSSVTRINGEAFLDNASLETVYLKSTVLNTLGDNAFTNLKSGSIIYTASKAIADKFVAGTHYTNGRTSIYYPPEITVQPISVTVNSGNNATFTITAQAGNPNGVTYKWQYRTSDTDNWKDCTAEQGTGYDTASFTTVQTKTAMNGYSYRCVISSSTYPNEIMTQDELADKLVSEVAKLNVELNIAGDEVIVDKTAPILKSHDISDTMKVPGTITITAVLEDPEVEAGVPGSGVNTSATRYAITDTNVAPAADASIWQASNVFTTSSRAMVYVWIKAVDNVGNVRIIGDMTSDRTSLADTTAPTIDSIKVTYDETDATLTIKATDTGSGIDKITVNGKEINLTRDGNSVTGVFDVTEEGIYVIIVTDVCGNETTATRTAYEIKYDGNTAEAGSVPMQIKINGVDRKLNMNTYTKVMHKFENWNTKKDGTGNTYAEGAMYSADESATMYAQWTCTEIPIVITKQPEDVELTEGESTVVTVEATGSNIVYRWQISEDGGTTWNDITGKTKNTLELNDTTLDMSGNKYRCILTNYYGDTISNAMTLTVNIKLVVGELELRKDTTTGAIYDVDIWTKSVIHVKLIPGVGGTTTYMSLAGSAQTVEETTENSVIRTSGVTVLRVKTARGSAEVTKDYIIKVDKDAPIGGTIALDGKQREDDTTIKLKASGFVDEHSGIAQYVWEYKSNKEATFRQGKVDKSGEGESYFTFDAEDNTSYVVRVVVYDNVGNSVTVTADKEFSLIGTSVKMKPTIRFTNVDKIVINEETGNKEVRAKVIFKSSSPLTKIVIGGNQIDVSTITPKMIGKEYVYETTYVITSNGVYVASCEDSDGGKAKEEVAISVFNTPNVKYKIVESGTYKEIVFTSTVPVKILETTPSKYKTEVVTDSGEYSFTNKMLVTEDEIDINFVFVDEHGNESNTVNVKIEAVIGKLKFVRAVDDKAGNKYEPFDKMNVDTAYRLAQDMENKIATINSKVVSYYGTNNGQTDMFMSRARDVGATVYLMNASKAGTYNGKMIKDLGGNPTSEVATYGLQGIGTKQEYTSAYVKGATSNSLTTANTKYKDVITSVTTLRLYKGFAMADYPSASGSLDTGFVVRTGEKAYATQNGETNTNSSFRITLINK